MKPAPWPLLPPWMKPILWSWTYWRRARGGLWIRLYGSPALCIENRNVLPPRFDEREGIIKPLRVGRFALWMQK